MEADEGDLLELEANNEEDFLIEYEEKAVLSYFTSHAEPVPSPVHVPSAIIMHHQGQFSDFSYATSPWEQLEEEKSSLSEFVKLDSLDTHPYFGHNVLVRSRNEVIPSAAESLKGVLQLLCFEFVLIPYPSN